MREELPLRTQMTCKDCRLRGCQCGHDFRRGITPLVRPAQVAAPAGPGSLDAR